MFDPDLLFRKHLAEVDQLQPRIDYAKAATEVRVAMNSLDDHVRDAGVDRGLIELVKLRASLIDGCSY